MYINYFYLSVLFTSIFACSVDNWKEDLTKINGNNSSLSIFRIENVSTYKFSDSVTYNYTFINDDDELVIFDEKTHSFIIFSESKELCFYDSDKDSLYMSIDESDFVFTEVFIDDHMFVLDPDKYLNGNGAKKFAKLRSVNDELSQLRFELREFNTNVLIDKMFIKSVGTYYYNEDTYLIHKYVKEIDQDIIAGDGVYRKTYNVSYDMSDKEVAKIIRYTDSIIAVKSSRDFIGNFYPEERFLSASNIQEMELEAFSTIEEVRLLTSLEGNQMALSDLKSDYILVDFWFMRCPGCIQGIPHMNVIYNEFPEAKLSVIGVNPVDNQIEAIKDFAQKKNIKYPIYLSSKGFADKYDIKSYPTYVLLDNRGEELTVLGVYNLVDELKSVLDTLD